MKDRARNYTCIGNLKDSVFFRRFLSKKNTNFPEYNIRYDSFHIIWCIEKYMTSYHMTSLLANCINAYWLGPSATY